MLKGFLFGLLAGTMFKLLSVHGLTLFSAATMRGMQAVRREQPGQGLGDSLTAMWKRTLAALLASEACELAHRETSLPLIQSVVAVKSSRVRLSVIQDKVQKHLEEIQSEDVD